MTLETGSGQRQIAWIKDEEGKHESSGHHSAAITSLRLVTMLEKVREYV